LTKDVLLRSLRHVQVGASPSSASIAEHLNDREYQVVLRAVMRYPRRLDQAARELGVSRTTLWRRMRKYDIRVPGSAER
jgi:two-component system response regulator HydG